MFENSPVTQMNDGAQTTERSKHMVGMWKTHLLALEMVLAECCNCIASFAIAIRCCLSSVCRL